MTEIPTIGDNGQGDAAQPPVQKIEIPREAVMIETCPECRGTDFTPLIRLGRVPGFYVGDPNRDIFTYIPNDNLQCARCGLVFRPNPSPDARPQKPDAQAPAEAKSDADAPEGGGEDEGGPACPPGANEGLLSALEVQGTATVVPASALETPEPPVEGAEA